MFSIREITGTLTAVSPLLTSTSGIPYRRLRLTRVADAAAGTVPPLITVELLCWRGLAERTGNLIPGTRIAARCHDGLAAELCPTPDADTGRGALTLTVSVRTVSAVASLESEFPDDRGDAAARPPVELPEHRTGANTLQPSEADPLPATVEPVRFQPAA